MSLERKKRKLTGETEIILVEPLKLQQVILWEIMENYEYVE